MTIPTPRFHILTGGPGSGKSTLLAELSRLGLPHMPEAGRAIIQDQLSIGGNALPWADRSAFAELMLSWELRSYREAQALSGPVLPAPVLFDRGVPDVLGYLRLCALPIPPHVLRAAQTFRYHPRVFLAPVWPEIFTQDAERKQSLAEAEATCQALASTYTDLGYELIELPRTSVEARARFVLDHLSPPQRA